MKLLARKNVSESAITANNNRNNRRSIVKLQSVYLKISLSVHNRDTHKSWKYVVDQSLPVKMKVIIMIVVVSRC